MRPLWVTQYQGVPFLERGRDRAGWDCWGCLRAVFQEQRGLTLPSYAEDYATTTDAEEITALLRGEVASQWQPVPVAEACLFDVAIFRILGQPIHFALVLDAPYFLHASKGVGTTVERWDALIWVKRLLQVVRFAEQPVGASSAQ